MKLSVIIPGYNTPKSMWQRCVKSVLAALDSGDEVILVDDGSREVVTEEWLDITDNRVTIVRQTQNQGQSAARNKALDIVQGDYVTFVDSDDEVLPDIYRHSLKAAEKYKRDIVAFGIRSVWPKDDLEMSSEFNERDIGSFTVSEMQYFIRKQLFDCPVNKLYRRSFLEKNRIRFPDGICPGEDAMFVLDCVMHNATWATVDGVGYIYYRMDGTTLSRYQSNLPATLTYWKNHWDAYMSKIGVPYTEWWPTRDYSPKWVDEMLWNNLWTRGSPVSFAARWCFLREHASSFAKPLAVVFINKAIYTFLRLHFYIRPIRRWHLKRQWGNIHDIKKGET